MAREHGTRVLEESAKTNCESMSQRGRSVPSGGIKVHSDFRKCVIASL